MRDCTKLDDSHRTRSAVYLECGQCVVCHKYFFIQTFSFHSRLADLDICHNSDKCIFSRMTLSVNETLICARRAGDIDLFNNFAHVHPVCCIDDALIKTVA